MSDAGIKELASSFRPILLYSMCWWVEQCAEYCRLGMWMCGKPWRDWWGAVKRYVLLQGPSECLQSFHQGGSQGVVFHQEKTTKIQRKQQLLNCFRHLWLTGSTLWLIGDVMIVCMVWLLFSHTIKLLVCFHCLYFCNIIENILYIYILI